MLPIAAAFVLVYILQVGLRRPACVISTLERIK